ncbi:hypothetical protein KFE94_09790 [bacterium SCSIO 12643]|nr:hypothetical protein KFE94_09790 [bacterium SCSIO 12643]
MSGNAVTCKQVCYLNSIAELRQKQNSSVGDIVITKSYYGDNNGGGNEFECISVTSTGYTDNAGTTIIGNDNRVWRAVVKDYIYVEQFGVRDESVSQDSTIQMQACFDYFKTSLESSCYSETKNVYMIESLTLDDMKDNCRIDLQCTLKKTVAAVDAMVRFSAQTKPMKGIYLKLNLDGNGDNQTTYQPNTSYDYYPVKEYFGHNPPVGFAYPIGTGLYITEADYDLSYIEDCVVNVNGWNWGKSLIYGNAVKSIRYESIIADTVLLHPLGIAAPYNPDRKKYTMQVDYIKAYRCGTIFDISAPVKNDYDYSAECNIVRAEGEEVWLNSKLSGAWSLTVQSILFYNCGTNPTHKLAVGDENKYFAYWKTEQSEHYGIHFDSITAIKCVRAGTFSNGYIGEINLIDQQSTAVSLHNMTVEKMSITGTDKDVPANVLPGVIDYNSKIGTLCFENVISDIATTLFPLSGYFQGYSIYTSSGNCIIDNIIFNGYRNTQAWWLILPNVTQFVINNILFLKNQYFETHHGLNNYATNGAAFLTLSQVDGAKVSLKNTDFTRNVEITDPKGVYFRSVTTLRKPTFILKDVIGMIYSSGCVLPMNSTTLVSSAERSGNMYQWNKDGIDYYSDQEPDTELPNGQIKNVTVKSVSSLPLILQEGYYVYISELKKIATLSGSIWLDATGIQCVGPSSVWNSLDKPFGFKYYDTDTSSVRVYDTQIVSLTWAELVTRKANNQVFVGDVYIVTDQSNKQILIQAIDSNNDYWFNKVDTSGNYTSYKIV